MNNQNDFINPRCQLSKEFIRLDEQNDVNQNLGGVVEGSPVPEKILKLFEIIIIQESV